MRIYVGTSVFGGVFDVELGAASGEFFQQIADGRFRVGTPAAVDAGSQGAPEPVRRLYELVLPLADVLPIAQDARDPAEEYVRAGAVTARSREDALHVALATIHGCAALVSWDFRHQVHFERIRPFNATNGRLSHPRVEIVSPLAVIQYDDEDF